MERKKKDLNRAVMMREAWIEDGRTIGRLKLANSYLAGMLAEAGLRPEGCDGQDFDVEGLTRAWIQAAEVDAALTYGQGGRA